MICCFSAFEPFQILNICLDVFAIHLRVVIKFHFSKNLQNLKENLVDTKCIVGIIIGFML